MKNIFLSVLIMVIITGCDDSEVKKNAPMKIAKHYIYAFIDCKQLKVSSTSEDCDAFYVNENEKILGNDGKGEKIGNFGLGIRGLPGKYLDYYNYYTDHLGYTNENNKRVYYNYLEQLGDTCFNRLLSNGFTDVVAITVPLKTISITCDKDFNKEYPAGSEMNELFTVFFDDAYATVKNEYKRVEGSYMYYLQYNNGKYNIPHSIYKIKLSEANFIEHPFITNDWGCISDAIPEKTDEYIFHVKITFADGTEIEETAPPVKLKGKID